MQSVRHIIALAIACYPFWLAVFMLSEVHAQPAELYQVNVVSGVMVPMRDGVSLARTFTFRLATSKSNPVSGQ